MTLWSSKFYINPSGLPVFGHSCITLTKGSRTCNHTIKETIKKEKTAKCLDHYMKTVIKVNINNMTNKSN